MQDACLLLFHNRDPTGMAVLLGTSRVEDVYKLKTTLSPCLQSPMIDFPFLSFSISYINMAFLKVIFTFPEDLSRPRAS